MIYLVTNYSAAQSEQSEKSVKLDTIKIYILLQMRN